MAVRRPAGEVCYCRNLPHYRQHIAMIWAMTRLACGESVPSFTVCRLLDVSFAYSGSLEGALQNPRSPVQPQYDPCEGNGRSMLRPTFLTTAAWLITGVKFK